MIVENNDDEMIKDAVISVSEIIESMNEEIKTIKKTIDNNYTLLFNEIKNIKKQLDYINNKDHNTHNVFHNEYKTIDEHKKNDIEKTNVNILKNENKINETKINEIKNDNKNKKNIDEDKLKKIKNRRKPVS